VARLLLGLFLLLCLLLGLIVVVVLHACTRAPSQRIPRKSFAGTNKFAGCATAHAHAWWSPRACNIFARARKS
jgi:hypothetical protein